MFWPSEGKNKVDTNTIFMFVGVFLTYLIRFLESPNNVSGNVFNVLN